MKICQVQGEFSCDKRLAVERVARLRRTIYSEEI